MFASLDGRRSLVRHFEKAAPFYHGATAIQQEIAANLGAKLVGFASPNRILEIGSGTGALTEHLLRLFPESQITAIDLSKEMIGIASERLAYPANVLWLCESAEEFITKNREFDLIVSSSSFQWIENLGEFFARLMPRLSMGGTLLFSMMVKGTLAELHDMRKLVAPTKISQHDFLTEQEVQSALERSGYLVKKSEVSNFSENFANTTALLKEIRRRGFTGGKLSLGRSPLNRGELSQLIEICDRRNFANGQQVRATFKSALFEAVSAPVYR